VIFRVLTPEGAQVGIIINNIIQYIGVIFRIPSIHLFSSTANKEIPGRVDAMQLQMTYPEVKFPNMR